MAVSAARALLTAHLQGAWNRMRHESGLAGASATLAAAGAIVVAVLVVPSAIMARVGASLGKDLAHGSSEALAAWSQLQAVFTLLFPLLGSVRFAPALCLRELGSYPLSRRDIALAELPAAAVEVFPLLGLAWITATNAGLAWTLPALAPGIAVLAALGMAWMLALTVLLASVGRLLALRRATAVATAAALCAAIAATAAHGWAATLREAWRLFAALSGAMPGALGYEGLLAARAGRTGAGVRGLLVAAAATAGLAWLAALAHHRALLAGAFGRTVRRAERPPAPYRGAVHEIAAATFRQLSRSRAVWVALVVPLVMTAPALVVTEAGRRVASHGGTPDARADFMTRLLDQAPLLAITLCLGVLTTSQVWLNQFGWDRGPIRSLLSLPIAARDILAGKLLGLFRVMLLGWTVCGGALLVFYRPSAREVLGGVAAAGTALVVAAGVGQVASLAAPRPVPRGGLAQTPLALGWIPMALVFVLGGLLGGLWGIGNAVGPWGGPVLLWLAFAGAVVGCRGLLPHVARHFLAQRERLLAM